jgi:ankyrin repeat protein
MKYLKLFENFEDYNPYDLTVMFPDERLKLFIEEIKKPTSEQNLNLVRDLINLDTINIQDNRGKTPLHWATGEGSVEIVRILIDAGADLNVKDKGGNTPLHIAVNEGEPETAILLINAKADLNVQNNDGWTPLHVAVYYDAGEVAWMLIDASSDLNVQGKNGDTPLHIAANEGNDYIVQMLIDAGADETILNAKGLRWDELIDGEEFYDEDDD